MDENLQKAIDRAKELLNTVRHATMATVNEDRTPHNTPFLFLHDQELNRIFWGSHPQSQHSKNILRTGKIFVVIYDALGLGGLYIKAEGGKTLEGKDLDQALESHNAFRAKEGKDLLSKEYYSGTNPQRMWSAKTVKFWVNLAERSENGLLIKDYRQEVRREDLLSN